MLEGDPSFAGHRGDRAGGGARDTGADTCRRGETEGPYDRRRRAGSGRRSGRVGVDGGRADAGCGRHGPAPGTALQLGGFRPT